MLAQLQQFVNNFNKPKNWLLLANVSLVFFLIVLNNLQIIPLRMGDFIFFAFLTLALALYRPGWAFLFFVGTIPLENINLAPIEFGIAIRPYQFIGALTILAIIIQLLSRKLNFKLVKLNFIDYLILVLVLAGFVSTCFNGSLTSIMEVKLPLKLSVILFTFSALYFLVRNYIQNLEDLKKIIPFFLSSSVVVVLYGIWQNVWFLRGLENFETMPGRPNATFSEADWLGMFLVLVISVLYSLVYRTYNYVSVNKNKSMNNKLRIKKIFLFLFLISYFLLLILTVSRSAWLGAFAVTFIFIFTIFTNLKFHSSRWQWKKTIKIKLIIFFAFFIAISSVYVFHLTNFQLFNRIQSTRTGLQKITISCNKKVNLPESIEYISKLQKYNCRHINIEEIDVEKAEGKYVSEIYRKDPNVSIRSEIYQKSWSEIKDNWVFGIGWGSIGNILGQDDREMNLNSSNIFLEIWLGSGILGFTSFVIVIVYVLLRAIKNYYLAKNSEEKIFGLFIIVSWFAIIIPNFFNAGIFLGVLWAWLAVAQIKK